MKPNLIETAAAAVPEMDLLFGGLAGLSLACLVVFIVRRCRAAERRAKASAFNHDLMAYHERINAARGLYSRRGGAVMEALAALAFCLVWSALLVALFACADAADLVGMLKP